MLHAHSLSVQQRFLHDKHDTVYLPYQVNCSQSLGKFIPILATDHNIFEFF
jgi:hypothetical protein